MSTFFEGLISKAHFSVRATVTVATTVDLDSVGNGTWVYSDPSLTAGTAGNTVIDGVTLAGGDRVLVKNQGGGATSIQNGIYEASATGPAIITVLTRVADLYTDFNASSTIVFCMQGTANIKTGWICTNPSATAVVATNALGWLQFDVINTLTVSRGGTGATTLNNNEVVIGQGTNPLTTITAANNAVLVTNGSGVPSWSTTLPNTLTVSFRDDRFSVYDDVTPTKIFQFQLDTISAGTVVGSMFPASDTFTGIAAMQTLTNKLMSSDKYNQLNDTNNNAMLILTPASSAVNQFTMTNAATTATPSLAVTGTDTNISMNLQAKGTGVYNLLSTSTAQTNLRFYENTTNGGNYIGLRAPASVTADLTFTLPALDGTSGQVMITDGSANLSFASTSSLGRRTYTLANNRINVTNPNYITVGYFAWKNSRYSAYTSGALVYSVTIGNRNMDIRLRNIAAGTNVIETLGVSATAVRVDTASFTNPVVDTVIELQVRKASAGGVNPVVDGVQLEWN